MSAYLSATVYAWIAHAIAFLLLPRSISADLRVRAVIFWASAAAVLFLLQDPLLVLIVAAGLLLLTMPAESGSRVAFFAISFAALPAYMTAPLPFPGLQHFLNITQLKVAVIALLLPLIIIVKKTNKPTKTISLTDFILLVFITYISVRGLYISSAAVHSSATGALRMFVDQVLTLSAPYLLIRYAIRSVEDLAVFLHGVLIASVLLGSTVLVAAFKQWDFYYLFAPPGLAYVETRSGFIRVHATLNNSSVGFFLLVGLVLLEVLRRQIHISLIALNSMRIVFLAGLPMTDSRGVIGAGGVVTILYFTNLINHKFLRRIVSVGIFMAGIVGSLWLLTGDFSSISSDSFSYRQNLLSTSYNYILKYPFFGDFNYLSSGYFDHLIQGQGIIDVTNLYLQIVLQHGLVGLALFFSAILFPMITLLRKNGGASRYTALAHRSQTRSGSAGRGAPLTTRPAFSAVRRGSAEWAEGDWFRARSALLALTCGWLFLVSTTSDGGAILPIGLILATLTQALANLTPDLSGTPEISSGRINRVSRSGVVSDAPSRR